MAATRRLQILLAVMERLSGIKTSDGYATDAGFTVILGEKVEFSEDDPTHAVGVVVLNDDVRYVGENVSIMLPIECQAIAKVDINVPWVAAEQILGDIKLAMEQPDRSLGGLIPGFIKRGSTRVLPRDPGSTTVGVGVTYLVPYVETWGAP
jgi:hypothetical protein